MVTKNIIANKDAEYKRLGSIINDARLAGLIDWKAIEDRTRNLITISHWSSPSDIIDACVTSYRRDTWVGQQFHVEVWVEKEALAGVFKVACDPLDVAVFPCRGYVSQSEMWAAAERLRKFAKPVILHFGDHDPSGLDMTRDITARLTLFEVKRLQVIRVALNMDQVEEYGPPPNPAKTTDARFAGYAEQYGDESWELDALSPSVLRGLVENGVAGYRDNGLYQAHVARQEMERERLQIVANNWGDVSSYAETLEEKSEEE